MESAGGSSLVTGKTLKGPKACSTCARAKSRCISGPGGQEKCERCHRLRKPCSSQTPAPARKRKQPKPTRVAALERRLEDLTARIESVQQLGQAGPSPPDSDHYALPSCPVGAPADLEHSLPPRTMSGTHVSVPTFGLDSWASPLGHIFPNRSIFENRPEQQQQPKLSGGVEPTARRISPPAPPESASNQPTTATSMGSSPNQHPPPRTPQSQGSCPWPQGDEAEAFLETYRTHMAHLFPFAIVPPHMSSAQIREQRPFLWKGIMVEACLFDGARQIALGNELLREISEAAFVRPQKSLDLLHGLQLLVAWYHYNLNNFQMINLLFLARSISTSLGSVESKGQPENGGYSSECLEQMRAFAGTYYIVTITFTTNRRPDALMNNINTSYLATCCRALHSQMEYPTDELVVHLVRAQQLAGGIVQGFARRKAVPDENRLPQAAFIRSLQERIQAFAAALPPHIRANPSLTGHLHVAEILIYENSLKELWHRPFAGGPCRGPMAAAAVDPALMSEMDVERVEMLWQRARVVHTFMANRFAHEIGDYPRFICLASFDMTYVFSAMFKLMTVQAPGWDLVRVRGELRFEDFISQLIKRMEYAVEKRKRQTRGKIKVSGQEDEPEDPYAKMARKARKLQDILHANGFDSDYATSQMEKVWDTAPMTLVDATQDLMQDLGGGLWQDAPSPSEWDLFLLGDVVDWTAVFNSYAMSGSGYTG